MTRCNDRNVDEEWMNAALGRPLRHRAAEEVEKLQGQVKLLNARLERVLDLALRYRDALRRIRKHEGRVCEQYEICEHEACTSSYAAWATADMALSGAEKCIHCSCSPCCSCGERRS